MGSGWSDVPVDESLWDLDRFVDEVEQVRTALGLDRDSFVLLGHSWGGIIGAAHDTMDPAHMAEVARRLPQGSYLHCPNGSHMAMYDDQETYFQGLIGWLGGLA